MSPDDFRVQFGIIFLSLALLVMPVPVMADLASTPWPMFQHDLNTTGLSPYVASQTNTVKWTYTTGGAIYRSGVAIGLDGTLYIGSKDGYVYALNPNGTKKWSYTTGEVWTTPAVGSDGTVYIGTKDGYIYALNSNGTLKWSYYNGGIDDGSPAIGTDGTIYVGSQDKKVYALNPDGTLKWSYTTGGYVTAPTIGTDGTVYIGSYDKKIYALNPDGTLKWSYTLGSSKYGAPTIGTDGTIYSGCNDKKVYALNPDGTLKWSYTTGGYIMGTPSIGPDGTIYVGSQDKKVYALNPNGTLKWSYTTGGILHQYWGSSAVGADGTLYIGNYGNGNVYALNPDGTLKWTYTGGFTYSSPTIGPEGTLYMGSSDGKLYAFAGAVDFTADHPSGGAPLAVQFTGISPLTVTTWSWDFGDGTTSTEQNPSHTFISVGSFTVNLTITHHDGTNYLSRTAYINVYAPPVACFSTNPTTGKAPVIIQFTDESTGIPTAWFWDFGDGDSTNATVQNPVHRYSLPETYTINLTVTNPAGSNTSSKVKYITVISPLVPVANFTSDVTSGKSPLTVQFTDQSTSAPASWLWDFGDGTTSDEQNPTHSYSTTGTDTVTYTVNLTATNSAGSNTTSKTNYITLYSNPPTVSFIATPRISTTAPLTVQFHDTTILSPTSWLWDFGDGDNTNATVQNPVHTYATAGTYTVNLTATNAIGSSTASRPGFITFVTQAPIAYNGANIYVSNDEGVKYDNNGTSLTYIPNTYGFAMAGGLNALSLSDTTKDIIINTRNQSGTFYAAFGGGQSTMPEGILLLAVKEPIPDDFGVRIRSSGYNWTPPGPAMYNGGLPAEYNYLDGAVNQTFTKNDFIYGPQIWRPCSAANYPIYNGQDMSNTGDTFQIMFIDLNVGAVGSFEDGLIKIEYNFTNLTSFAAFDVYGWYLASNHGTGIIMTNDISKSSYMVTGIPAAPVADFTSSTISADVISPVQFTDTSANVPQSWYWEFGDGTTSALQNPTHTYSTPNTYTVNLTVINYKGTDKVAKTGYITKIIPPVPIADFTANTTSGTYPLPVQFTDASANTPSSWSWDFGDGTTSTEKNPVHWFGSGTFTVNLTVTNSGGTNSIVKNNFVTVASSGSTNRFLNPGFETGDLTGWTGGATYTSVSSTHTHSGSDAVFFDYTGGSTYTYVAQRIDLTNVTNISFWGYQDNSFPLTQYFYSISTGLWFTHRRLFPVHQVHGHNSRCRYPGIPVCIRFRSSFFHLGKV